MPDQVLSLYTPSSNTDGGNTFSIYTDQTHMTATLTLPTNVERAYLDVIPEAQSGDEFWYTCVPEAAMAPTQNCGGTDFREAEVSIDGQSVGFVPISPWIYTGGIDPYLWRPVPGVQTLDFKPFRVDLTPFAAMLSNGQPHTFSISVTTGDPTFQNNSQRFDTAATLLLFDDAGSTQITGGMLGSVSDTGVHPVSTLSNNSGVYDMNVTSRHNFSARGYVNTSHGRVITAVAESASFSNRDITNPAIYDQNINLQSNVVSTSTTIDAHGTSNKSRNWSFPLLMDYKYVVNPDGSGFQATTIDQRHGLHTNASPAGAPRYFDSLDYHDQAADTLLFDSNSKLTGNSGQRATQSYLYKDSYARCYSRTVDAASGAVTAVTDAKGCP